MISTEQINHLQTIIKLEQEYIKKYGMLFHNLAYRETSVVYALQTTIDPSIQLVPGSTGIDAKDSNNKSIELKSTNNPSCIRYNKNGNKAKGKLGRGHFLEHSNHHGKFDKMHSEERYNRVKQYDAFAFSIFANQHLPEMVFYINNKSGVDFIHALIENKRNIMLEYKDTASFKGSTIDIHFKEIFNNLDDQQLIILAKKEYINPSQEQEFMQISKEDYNKYIVGSEFPKGNILKKA